MQAWIEPRHGSESKMNCLQQGRCRQFLWKGGVWLEMRKTRKQQSRLKMATTPPTTASAKQAAVTAKAERIVQRVKDHHAMGLEANTEQIKNGTTTEELAVKKGLDSGALRRFKLFAKSYSAEQLVEFCMLRRLNRLPLHWGYLPYLLTIKNPVKRTEMAANAATNGWSPTRLHAEIRKLEGRPPGHGRRVELPKNPTDAIQQIVREGNLWLARAKKFVVGLAPNKPASKTRRGDNKLDLSELTALLETVSSEIGRLRKQLGPERVSAKVRRKRRQHGKTSG